VQRVLEGEKDVEQGHSREEGKKKRFGLALRGGGARHHRRKKTEGALIHPMLIGGEKKQFFLVLTPYKVGRQSQCDSPAELHQRKKNKSNRGRGEKKAPPSGQFFNRKESSARPRNRSQKG